MQSFNIIWLQKKKIFMVMSIMWHFFLLRTTVHYREASLKLEFQNKWCSRKGILLALGILYITISSPGDFVHQVR